MTPCLLLAQSGHPDTLNQCPLLGVKRTSRNLGECPLLTQSAQLSRSAPIEVLNILLRIILAPAIDEPLTSYAWLIGELDPVVLINFCDPFADCRLTFNDQFIRG